MFKEYLQKSTILSLTSEESSEETHRLVLKVHGNESKWMKLVYLMLKAAEETETFGVSVSKEFFLDEDGSATYTWVCTFWGDKDDAVSVCGPLLSKRFGPPAPPKSVAAGAQAVRPSLSGAKVSHLSGGVTAITVPLPHRRGDRSKDPNTIVKVGESSAGPKGLRASVQGIK